LTCVNWSSACICVLIVLNFSSCNFFSPVYSKISIYSHVYTNTSPKHSIGKSRVKELDNSKSRNSESDFSVPITN
jgi:hypothetical protein